MNLDPQTMAQLMQQAGPLMQQTLQGGPQQQQPTYPQRVVPPGEIVTRPRPGRDNYEMQEQYVRAQPGQGMPSVDYSQPQLGQPGAPQQPAQGPVPAQPASPAERLMALQSLYGKQV